MPSDNTGSRLPPGTIVAQRFQIVGPIGHGGMGTVYRAAHLTLPARFAIKVLRPDLAEQAIFVERFRREAVAASLAAHPNIVAITDFGHLPDVGHYMVMEYLEGETLEERLDRFGRLEFGEALHILVQLADAVSQAHLAGVIHRDLKPDNVLLCAQRGRTDVVKLVDFGIAEIRDSRYQGRQPASIEGQVFGTPEYMSPEQAMGRDTGPRSDIYSLGVLAFELVTGSPPFTGEPHNVLHAHVSVTPRAPSEFLDGRPVPPGFDACVLRCLAKKPGDRYHSAALLRRDLLKIRAGLAGLAENFVDDHRNRQQHPAFHVEAPWAPLGTEADEAYVVIETPSLDEENSPREQRLEKSGESARREYHQLLRELALSLSEAGVRSQQLGDLLDEILALEEERSALAAQIALLEQNFERIRFETGQRESSLSYAVLDLTMERRAIDPAASPEAATRAGDLDYQVAQLKKRLEDVKTERIHRIDALNRDILEFRRSLDTRDQDLASAYARLHGEILEVRAVMGTPLKLEATWKRLEQVRTQLDDMRKNATLV